MEPITHHVDVARAMATLDYGEMAALAELFHGWAFNEPDLLEDQRTKLIQWSADYERIAIYSGKNWIASDSDGPVDLIAFVAREAVKHHPPYGF